MDTTRAGNLQPLPRVDGRRKTDGVLLSTSDPAAHLGKSTGHRTIWAQPTTGAPVTPRGQATHGPARGEETTMDNPENTPDLGPGFYDDPGPAIQAAAERHL